MTLNFDQSEIFGVDPGLAVHQVLGLAFRMQREDVTAAAAFDLGSKQLEIVVPFIQAAPVHVLLVATLFLSIDQVLENPLAHALDTLRLENLGSFAGSL